MHAKQLGHPRQRGFVAADGRAALRARSWLLCRGWPNCFACAIDRGFVDADGRAALRARSIVGLLPRMADVWLRDPRRLRVDPRFACVILGLLRKSSDPRFVQQNPRMVRIRTLCITYNNMYIPVNTCVVHLLWLYMCLELFYRLSVLEPDTNTISWSKSVNTCVVHLLWLYMCLELFYRLSVLEPDTNTISWSKSVNTCVVHLLWLYMCLELFYRLSVLEPDTNTVSWSKFLLHKIVCRLIA